MPKKHSGVFRTPVATKGVSHLLSASSPDHPPRKSRKRQPGWRPSDAEIIRAIERRLAAVMDSLSSPPTPAQTSEIRRLEQLIATIRESGTV